MAQQFLVFPEAESLTREEKLFIVSMDNRDNPFRGFVGNKGTVKRISRLAFEALGSRSHRANGVSFSLLGPAGCGKTTVARKFAEMIDLTFVEGDPQSFKNNESLFEEIKKKLSEDNIELSSDENGVFDCPPIVLFIDEVHQLSEAVQNGLLTATDPKTATLTLPDGTRMKTDMICWIIATTDRGKLFDAFDTRFAKFTLQAYTAEEMAQIVQVHNPDMSIGECKLVSKYAGWVSREALMFVQEARIERKMQGCSWEQAIETIRLEQRIDSWGMSEDRLAILVALGQRGPISLANLSNVVRGLKTEELIKYILPPMRMTTPDRDPLLQNNGRGTWITEAGIKELVKRGIKYDIARALPKVA